MSATVNRKLSLISLASLLTCTLPACALPALQSVEVWERSQLASRVMQRNSSGTHAALEQHTYTSKESTSGGYGVGAGGCGCN